MTAPSEKGGQLTERLERAAFWLEQRGEHFTDTLALECLEALKEAKRIEAVNADLLAACERALAGEDKGYTLSPTTADMLRAAIAKARGGGTA